MLESAVDSAIDALVKYHNTDSSDTGGLLEAADLLADGVEGLLLALSGKDPVITDMVDEYFRRGSKACEAELPNG